MRRRASFSVALRGVRVADREQRTGHLDRQIELGALGDVAHVHVAADVARRNDAVQPRFGERDADGAAHRLEWHAAARPVHRGLEALVDLPVVQVRIGELIGQQPEARDVAGPAPARRLERQHGDLQRVARRGALDEHRPGDRVDAREVELDQIGRGRLAVQLARGGIDGLEVHHLAGRDAQRRRERVVPAVVDVLAMDRVPRVVV
jgi:hypothetical protein